MYRHRLSITLFIVLISATLPWSAACAGEVADADARVDAGESLRATAMDKYRKSAAIIDPIVINASRGIVVPETQTTAAMDFADENLNSALIDLTLRDNQLEGARGLGLDDTWQEYLSMLRESNEDLIDTINIRLDMKLLIANEPFALAGWDPVRTTQIVQSIQQMQEREQEKFTASEFLRQQAEQLRREYPGSFED